LAALLVAEFSAIQTAAFVEVKRTLIDKELNDSPAEANLATTLLAALHGIEAPIHTVLDAMGRRQNCGDT
jgi:hypothetical protein